MDYFSNINEDAYIRRLFSIIHARVDTLSSSDLKNPLEEQIEKVIDLFQEHNLDTERVIRKLEAICTRISELARSDLEILGEISQIKLSLVRWKLKKPPKKFKPSNSIMRNQERVLV